MNTHFQEWKQKNTYNKTYAHFDNRKNLQHIEKQIFNNKFVATHGFYPFIYYQTFFNKFKSGKLVKKHKVRDLFYSAHLDRYIYSYYGFLINEQYNIYMEKNNMANVATAYRNNLKQSNIDFAKEAFSFIKQYKKSFILIGDFTDFFNSLDHNYLKQNLLNVLNVTRLTDDFYNVFKNVTKYTYCPLEKLLELNNLNKKNDGVKELNQRKKVISMEEFKKNKKYLLHKNIEKFGIPQGAPISSVLSNVYMIEFDKSLHNFVKNLGGFYQRYSDDFIVVLPKLNNNLEFQNTIDTFIQFLILNINKTPNLKLHQNKTNTYIYSEHKIDPYLITNISNNLNNKKSIEFLGFEFNGTKFTIRDRAISKFYKRLYNKIQTINLQNGYTKKGNRISCKHLYQQYSIKGIVHEGITKKKYSNFLTYVYRADHKFKIFNQGNKIIQKTKRHLIKIRRKLDEISM